MPFRPEYPGEYPTLGWDVLEWMTEHLAQPDRMEYEPFVPTEEQAQFVLQFYRLDPETGRRLYRRALWSRPKGHGKSPLLAGFAIAEALADVVPDGWDANGRPVGRPWASIRTPLVQLAAVSEKQTRNSWGPLLEMMREGPLVDAYPGIYPMETFVALPKGRIEFVTSSSTSLEGNRPIFACLDQTEEWKESNGGRRMAETLRRNLGKTDGTSIESPNAFEPGAGSVAEESAKYAELIEQGKVRDRGFLLDHREAPADVDMTDRDSLMRGLAVAYGDSADVNGGWVNLDRIVSEIWDPSTDTQNARRYYLNQITHAADAFVTYPEWEGTKDPREVKPNQIITLGFDGSRGRARGKPDATALIACRVPDGYLFELGVWEAPDGPGQETWEPPLPAIEAAIADAFARYKVVGFYADPARDWRSYVNRWEARYGRRVKVRVSANHPFEWWMTGGRSFTNQRAIEQFSGAVRNGDLAHDGSFRLTQHMLNARRRIQGSHLKLAKKHDYSSDKIDAAVAAVLAWQARLDALSKGIGTRRVSGVIKRAR